MSMSIRMKLANILRNFHRTAEHPEAEDGDVYAAIDATLRLFDSGIEIPKELHPSVMRMLDSYPRSMPSRDDPDVNLVWMTKSDYEALKRREQDLLEANNRYLQRARDAEAIDRNKRRATQAAMLEWAIETFSYIEGLDPTALVERVRRFFEEAAELAQACGLNAAGAAKVLERVYSNPVGSPYKELGQAQMTLSILAEVLGVTAASAEAEEFDRVQDIPKAEFERRHRAKMEIGI